LTGGLRTCSISAFFSGLLFLATFFLAFQNFTLQVSLQNLLGRLPVSGLNSFLQTGHFIHD
ncbi:hypothetical protein, partial [Klebsiella pneumoniae]